MYKKTFLTICSFALTLVLLFNLTSCGVREVLELDENLHYAIETIKGEDGLEGIYYKGEKYYIDKWNLFTVTNNSWDINEEDVLLSWNGTRFGYKKNFYSYTKDSPLFIHDGLYDVFFNEAYDYLSDTFVIVGTNAEIVFSDITSDLSEHRDIKSQEYACVQLYSKEHPRIRMKLDLKCIENQWYFRSALPGLSPAWTASDDFVQLLSDNGII